MIKNKQLVDKLNELTDEEFEDYMLEKYGPRWILKTLLPEELDRCPNILTDDEIRELLRLGEEDSLLD